MQNDGRLVYTCIASNEAGSAEQHYRINILGKGKNEILTLMDLGWDACLVPPTIQSISIAPTARPIAGNYFTLECHANGIPEPVISWHLNK